MVPLKGKKKGVKIITMALVGSFGEKFFMLYSIVRYKT